MKGYEGRTVLVFGLGRSGVAAARMLAEAGAHPVCADERRSGAVPGLPDGIEPRLGPFAADLLGGVDEVVVSPGVPGNHPLFAAARAAGAPVIGELELAFRFSEAPVIAVTGTNGKSTTVSMIGAILAEDGRRAIVAGNVGVPFSSVVRSIGPDGYFVIEVSSFQLETVDRFHPRSAGMLNMTPDHLDRYARLEDYYEAKERIIEPLGPGDVFFYNADDARCAALAGRTRAGAVPFSVSTPVPGGVFLEGRYLIRSMPGGTEEIFVDRRELAAVGLHNVENALAAVAALSGLGVRSHSCRRALEQFRGLPHRMERVAEIAGVTFYNDSKATNVEAAVRSIEGLEAPVVLIAGGRDKGGDFTKLLGISRIVRRIVTIGEAAGPIEEAVAGEIPCARAGSMCEAVREAAASAAPGWLVVLSPACASFDMFEDFEHRGREFRRCVEEEARR
ncbi:MAG: UDP-N-acetylmuramoyl-L-alanine--D-glutamate ligase [Candidatus Krumholzibacteria bacterium]|nr:UDP-N-acetylmuramoyl-L-alanine--D-glutamate ligase [Candidatus Krumholzibacteria bacterium]